MLSKTGLLAVAGVGLTIGLSWLGSSAGAQSGDNLGGTDVRPQPIVVLTESTLTPFPAAAVTITSTDVSSAILLPPLSATQASDLAHSRYTSTELAEALARITGQSIALIGCPWATSNEYDVSVEDQTAIQLAGLGIKTTRIDGISDSLIALQRALASHPAAVIACTDDLPLTPALVTGLTIFLHFNIPVITYGASDAPDGVVAVAADDSVLGYAAGNFAAQGLVAMNQMNGGAIVLSVLSDRRSSAREDGVKSGLVAAGLSPDAAHYYFASNTQSTVWAALAQTAFHDHPNSAIVICLVESCSIPVYRVLVLSGTPATSRWVVGIGGDVAARNAIREGKWFAGYVDRGVSDTASAVVNSAVRRLSLAAGMAHDVTIYGGRVISLGTLPGSLDVLENTSTPFPVLTQAICPSPSSGTRAVNPCL